jgi:hypothetical protein
MLNLNVLKTNVRALTRPHTIDITSNRGLKRAQDLRLIYSPNYDHPVVTKNPATHHKQLKLQSADLKVIIGVSP